MIREPYQLEKDEEEEPRKIPSDNPLAMTNFKLNEPSHQSNLSASEINIAATDQSGNLRKMQQAVPRDANSSVQESKRTFQPSEANNVSRVTDQQPSERPKWQLEETKEEPGQESSLWDDPDLVPVPVLPDFNDNSMTYEVHGGEKGE